MMIQSLTACLLLVGVCSGQLHNVQSPMVSHTGTTHVLFNEDSRYGLHDPIYWEGYLKPGWRQTMQFELLSNQVEWIEVFLFVSNNLENYIDISITSSGNSAGKADPHLTAGAKCLNFFDNCQQQRIFQYTLPPNINKTSCFQNRLALRVSPHLVFETSPLNTNWTIHIRNKLPVLTTNALVRLEVRQYTKNYTLIAIPVVIASAVIILASVYFIGWLQERRQTSETEVTEVPNAQETALQMRQAISDTAVYWRDRVRQRYMTLRESNQETEGVEMDDQNSDLLSQSDDEEMCCRICRSTAPREDLFSPCKCRGSVKYVHRTCLEEWRQKTVSSTNKKQCSECKGHFKIAVTYTKKRYLYAMSVVKNVLALLLTLLVMELIIISVGYLFKGVAGVLTNDLDHILWDINLYHHLVGIGVIVTTIVHYHILEEFLSDFIKYRVIRLALIVLSTLLEVVIGYLTVFVLWIFNSSVWDWQISYLTGIASCFFYRVVLHDVLRQQYARWRERYTVERVVEPADGSADVQVDVENGDAASQEEGSDSVSEIEIEMLPEDGHQSSQPQTDDSNNATANTTTADSTND
eukprot:TRINITY_DN240_c4_g1_i1.p1 TRINITY_DN240_c4_g1~~TRINITY_DN240_c4_g1_i1.p1  ORF type:complete len:603 (+),score=102.50 TRINITY_DN240_c4_g1_i1:72-1811(+)